MERRALRLGLFASIVVALLVASASSQATTYVYTFSGTVDTTNNPAFIGIGETFSGNFQYNDLVPDVNPNPSIGDYIGVGTIDVSYSGGFSINSSFGQIIVGDLAADTWTFYGFDDGDPLLSVVLQLSDPTGTALSSDALEELLPGGFSTQILSVADANTGDSASGPVSVIPEPATGILVGFGCIGLAIRRRCER
jgi:hypothetical protein